MTLTPKKIGIRRQKLKGFDFKTGKPTKWSGLAPRRTTKPKVKRKRPTLGKLLKKADTLFSARIRARDGKCMHPKGTEYCKLLQCSHYHGRAIKSTRFDPDNCVTICWFHHYKSKDLGFEYQKQTQEKHGFDGQYTVFTRHQLGTERFDALNRRAKEPLKLTREYLENLIASLSTDSK